VLSNYAEPSLILLADFLCMTILTIVFWDMVENVVAPKTRSRTSPHSIYRNDVAGDCVSLSSSSLSVPVAKQRGGDHPLVCRLLEMCGSLDIEHLSGSATLEERLGYLLNG
jgi:hypothetical protein